MRHYIGFQMQISRSPNLYHLQLWDVVNYLEGRSDNPKFNKPKTSSWRCVDAVCGLRILVLLFSIIKNKEARVELIHAYVYILKLAPLVNIYNIKYFNTH